MIERELRIPEHHIRTPQEDNLAGGTPDNDHIHEEFDWYRPYGLLTRNFSFEFVNQGRKSFKTFKGLIPKSVLNLGKGSLTGEFLYEDIDPETYTTSKDPTLTGLYIVERQLTPVDSRASRQIYERLAEMGYNNFYHLRIDNP